MNRIDNVGALGEQLCMCVDDGGTCKKIYNFASIKPMTTYAIVAGGVTTQYDQKIVRLINRSKASPEAACVI